MLRPFMFRLAALLAAALGAAAAQAQPTDGRAPAAMRAGDAADPGWISFVYDRRSGRIGAGLALRDEDGFWPTAEHDGVRVDLPGSRLEAGKYFGLRGVLSGSGLVLYLGVAQHDPAAQLAGPGTEGAAVALEGGLRYDFGAIAFAARIDSAASESGGRIGHYRTLAAELPLGSGFTLSAGFSKPWSGLIDGFSVPGHTRWSVSGAVAILDFDVMLSFSGTDPSDGPEPSITETLLKVRRAF